MKIDIRSNCIELTVMMHSAIERQLHFALDRFGTRVTAVTVALEDLHGPYGKVDKQCRLIATLLGSRHLRAEAIATEITPAVDQAVDRLARTVARELERGHRYPTYRPSVTRISGATLFQRQKRSREQALVA